MFAQNDDAHRPIQCNEDSARKPVVHRSKTGEGVPYAFWLALLLFIKMDQLTLERHRVKGEAWRRVQEDLAEGRCPEDGEWVTGNSRGDSYVWLSDAEVVLNRELQGCAAEIDRLIAIYEQTALDTPDANAALAALHTARLDPWPKKPGTAPASYIQALEWLAEHYDDEQGLTFWSFRDHVRYLVFRPHGLEGELAKQARALG